MKFQIQNFWNCHQLHCQGTLPESSSSLVICNAELFPLSCWTTDDTFPYTATHSALESITTGKIKPSSPLLWSTYNDIAASHEAPRRHSHYLLSPSPLGMNQKSKLSQWFLIPYLTLLSMFHILIHHFEIHKIPPLFVLMSNSTCKYQRPYCHFSISSNSFMIFPLCNKVVHWSSISNRPPMLTFDSNASPIHACCHPSYLVVSWCHVPFY